MLKPWLVQESRCRVHRIIGPHIEAPDQVRALVEKKLEIPVLAIAGKEGIGANHEAIVRAFSCNLVDNIIVLEAGRSFRSGGASAGVDCRPQEHS